MFNINNIRKMSNLFVERPTRVLQYKYFHINIPEESSSTNSMNFMHFMCAFIWASIGIGQPPNYLAYSCIFINWIRFDDISICVYFCAAHAHHFMVISVHQKCIDEMRLASNNESISKWARICFGCLSNSSRNNSKHPTQNCGEKCTKFKMRLFCDAK